ncbi:hypothetical protein P4O66_010583 [Electrophorus voltai]|uniref:Discs, large (Drosophila) homolog-associated protein 1b n=1 Tax=Electrophorus voltai TaxID=2609070 RepID=A0AAD8Z9K8_9TELE|nr:hypothetical protein P4O66_010583 [Electrophorus voltai]
MTMGRHPGKPHYFLEHAYSTLGKGGGASLKTSRSNNDVGACAACSAPPGGGQGRARQASGEEELVVQHADGEQGSGGLPEGAAQCGVKRWSKHRPANRDEPASSYRMFYHFLSLSLALSPSLPVFLSLSLSVHFSLPRSLHLACPQVPQDEWSGFSALSRDEEIPCRRMRSGSYMKAMAEDDSAESDCSPRPSPKAQARRASYLRATQPSLTEMTTLKLSPSENDHVPLHSEKHTDIAPAPPLTGQDQFRELWGGIIGACQRRPSRAAEWTSQGPFSVSCRSWWMSQSLRLCTTDVLYPAPVPYYSTTYSIVTYRNMLMESHVQRLLGLIRISTETHSPKLQIRSHSYLRAVSEVSINRSLDSLDPAGLLASPKFRSRNESYMRAMSTISQVSEVEVNGKIEAVCESVFSEMESQAVKALDLPVSGSFRMRSHSYVRAIEKGCSHDEDKEEEEGGRVARQAISPPRTTTTVRTIQSSTVSSCITTYKKAPPPVLPRMAPTRPYISITTQSSTESAQDAYSELGGGGGGGASRALAAAHPNLSNSTESIDSMKALTAAIEAANAQVHGPASQHATNSTITITAAKTTANITHVSQDGKRDTLRKCLSIGVQVDGPAETAGSEHCKFQSVGIQVEEERCYRRVTRSDSVSAGVQADLDLVQEGGGEPAHPTQARPLDPTPAARQLSRDAATSTVSIQGSGNHYHACAQDDYSTVGFDPSVLPPPEPWMDPGTAEEEPCLGGRAGATSPYPRDGRWFLKLLQAEVQRMEGWCQQMEQDERDNELPEDILGKIRSAVGSAQLLMSQKFQQFRVLCEENLNPNAHPRPVSQDLAGFWDMLQLSIENISLKFDELHQLKANNWRSLEPPEQKQRRLPPPVPKKPAKCAALLVRDRSLEGSQRQEARKRLLAAKRAAATLRQNSAGECTDSIEIYIPEAQTRL